MKIAPLLRAIDKYNALSLNLTPILVHTGQHYDYEMSQIFFQDLKLPKPDVYLGVGSGTHAEQTGKIMIEFEKVLINEKPDLVIVVGDVNSTLAAALATVKLHIPIAHVEAGLRSYDKTMPEEINRLLTDHISDYLFTTSEYDDSNLGKEGIPGDKIFRVGNVMVDSLLYNKPLAGKSDVLERLGLLTSHQSQINPYVLVTLHRPSNVDDKQSLRQIITAVKEIARMIPVVFPAHPRTQKRLEEFNLLPGSRSKFLTIPPLGYLDFLKLEMNAKFVITDSGGIQVETTVLGIPCLTVLDSPVWTITHQQGTNILVGNDSQKLIKEAFKILDSKSKTESKSRIRLWDGKTAERIVEYCAKEIRRIH
jgi:UDP-N-acetylglucosamine 2-epimerase (non-hydrolysing)